MNSNLSYKGFTAKIEFSADDNVFVGRLIGIDDIVMFDSETVTGIKDAFHEAVDFHLEVCRKQGKKPNKTYNGKVLFRLSPELHKKIAEVASLNNKSVNEWGKEVFERIIKTDLVN